jgi:hypothetical protein
MPSWTTSCCTPSTITPPEGGSHAGSSISIGGGASIALDASTACCASGPALPSSPHAATMTLRIAARVMYGT